MLQARPFRGPDACSLFVVGRVEPAMDKTGSGNGAS